MIIQKLNWFLIEFTNRNNFEISKHFVEFIEFMNQYLVKFSIISILNHLLGSHPLNLISVLFDEQGITNGIPVYPTSHDKFWSTQGKILSSEW